MGLVWHSLLDNKYGTAFWTPNMAQPFGQQIWHSLLDNKYGTAFWTTNMAQPFGHQEYYDTQIWHSLLDSRNNTTPKYGTAFLLFDAITNDQTVQWASDFILKRRSFTRLARLGIFTFLSLFHKYPILKLILSQTIKHVLNNREGHTVTWRAKALIIKNREK